MNYAKAAILFFACWLVQTTLLGRIWPFGAAPNLLLCAVVCFAWLYDAGYGLIYGIVFGLLLDISVQALVGASALTFVLCCIPAFALRRVFNPERALPAVLSALIATPVYVFGFWGIYHLCGAPAGILPAVQTLPALLIAQALVCLALHLLLVRTIIKHRRDRRYIGGVL